jgi:hypothetical protein
MALSVALAELQYAGQISSLKRAGLNLTPIQLVGESNQKLWISVGRIFDPLATGGIFARRF